MQHCRGAVQVSDLQEVQRVQSELQVLQLAAPRLQLVDFLLQLVEQILGSPLGLVLRLPELRDQLVLLQLDGADQRGADLSAALNLSLCDRLSG